MIETPLKVFANPEVYPRGWYWALPAHLLKKGEKTGVYLFGESLVLYRGESGQVYCIEAFCPHMGANLKEGKVIGDHLRCGYHGWAFSGTGACKHIPFSSNNLDPATVPRRKSYLVSENFGTVWLHSDPQATLASDPFPSFTELAGQETVALTDPIGVRNCHPTIIMGGGIDEDHFTFVHAKATAVSGRLKFNYKNISPQVIRYENVATISRASAKSRFMHWLYCGVLKYDVTYWYASTALAALGPSFIPMYSIFAYRPTADGRTEGLNIYVQPKRRGPWGWFLTYFSLRLTRKILRGGGAEDKFIQNSIRFRPGPNAFDSAPFRAFVEYVENQPVHPTKGFAVKESAS